MLLLEKGFEGRHEFGGFWPSLAAVFRNADINHVWANAICVAAALLVFKALSVVSRNLGEGGLLSVFTAPLPEERGPAHSESPTATT